MVTFSDGIDRGESLVEEEEPMQSDQGALGPTGGKDPDFSISFKAPSYTRYETNIVTIPLG